MKTARVLATQIEYDTDGVSPDWLRAEGADLPKSLWLEVETDDDMEEQIADAISDVTGFCVLSFQFEAFGA